MERRTHLWPNKLRAGSTYPPAHNTKSSIWWQWFHSWMALEDEDSMTLGNALMVVNAMADDSTRLSSKVAHNHNHAVNDLVGKRMIPIGYRSLVANLTVM